MVLAAAAASLHYYWPLPATRTRPACCAAERASFSHDVWLQTQFAELDVFERLSMATVLLDNADEQLVNHAAWRGLGYTVDSQGQLWGADGQPRSSPPDFMGNSTALAQLEALLPHDDEEAMAGLETYVETLHGESLTKIKLAEGSADFIARRLIVQWLHCNDCL